jgi:hypothetical protein
MSSAAVPAAVRWAFLAHRVDAIKKDREAYKIEEVKGLGSRTK